MGFDIAKTAILTFEDTEWAGAEIRVRLDLSLADFMAVQTALADLGGKADAATVEAFTQFGDTVVKSWNLERDGEPIACSGEAFAALPMKMLNAIADVWSRTMTEVPDPLPEGSANGALLAERPA